MSSAFELSAEARCEHLQRQLDHMKKINRSNKNIIESQRLYITLCDYEILKLKTDKHALEAALRNKRYKGASQVKELQQKFEKELEMNRIWKESANSIITDLVEDGNNKDVVIRSLKKQLGKINVQEVQNHPKDVTDQFAKCETKSETDGLDDEIFQKELAGRITCKICVSDVERLRCSQCLKGICKGCHSKVENCPHCRNEKINFKPIIMSRL